MDKESDYCVVLFVDITDSTRLYDQYGDQVAKQYIDTCLQLLKRLTEQHQGTLIKSIGDELMCIFPTEDCAYLSSCEMHEVIKNHPQLKTIGMSVRIGFHSGSVIKEKQDVFGDTVNIAARVVSLALPDKTLVTEQVVNHLSARFKSHVRHFNQVMVKGKASPLNIWEILWKKSDTQMTMMVNKQNQTQPPVLTLNYQNKTFQLNQNSLPLIVGRSNQASIHIENKSISRTHLMIEYNNGKFKLTDRSTNGTYIKPAKGKPLFLKNEAILLVGQGEIILGQSVEGNPPPVIKYYYAIPHYHPNSTSIPR